MIGCTATRACLLEVATTVAANRLPFFKGFRWATILELSCGLKHLDYLPNEACLSARRCALGRNFVRCLHHFVDQFLEILQAGCGNDDGVSLAVTFLGNA